MGAEPQSEALDGPPQLSGRYDDMDIEAENAEIIIFDSEVEHAWVQSDVHVDAQGNV